jgi:hypothetical protein
LNFSKHGLYCGEDCPLQPNPKHPKQWREAYCCRRTVSAADTTPYKDYVLNICASR